MLGGGGIALLGLALIVLGAAPADSVPGLPRVDEAYVDSLLANLGTACFLFAPLYVVQQRIALRNREFAVARAIDIDRADEARKAGWPYQTPAVLSALLVTDGWTAEGTLDGHLVWSKGGRYEAFPLPRSGTATVSPLHVGYVGTAIGLNVNNFAEAVENLEREIPAVQSGELAVLVPAHAESGSNRKRSPHRAWQTWKRDRRLRRELPKRIFGSAASAAERLEG